MMPMVSIIITAYLEKSRPYLDLCLDSIENLDYPKDRLEVLIVSPYFKSQSVRVISEDTKNNAHALNLGGRLANKDSGYLLFCNDDVVFTRNSLIRLIQNSQSIGDHGIFMPMGNDQQMRYMWPVPGLACGPYRIEHTPVSHLKDQDSQFKYGMIFCESLCLYAVLVPRPVWELVGEYDERGWHDDIDYTKRVRQHGLINAICMNSLVYHAGGVSADVTLTPEMRVQHQRMFDEKWGE